MIRLQIFGGELGRRECDGDFGEIGVGLKDGLGYVSVENVKANKIKFDNMILVGIFPGEGQTVSLSVVVSVRFVVVDSRR